LSVADARPITIRRHHVAGCSTISTPFPVEHPHDAARDVGRRKELRHRRRERAKLRCELTLAKLAA